MVLWHTHTNTGFTAWLDWVILDVLYSKMLFVLPVEYTWNVFVDKLLVVVHEIFRFWEVISLRVKVKFTTRRRIIYKWGREKRGERGGGELTWILWSTWACSCPCRCRDGRSLPQCAKDRTSEIGWCRATPLAADTARYRSRLDRGTRRGQTTSVLCPDHSRAHTCQTWCCMWMRLKMRREMRE